MKRPGIDYRHYTHRDDINCINTAWDIGFEKGKKLRREIFERMKENGVPIEQIKRIEASLLADDDKMSKGDFES